MIRRRIPVMLWIAALCASALFAQSSTWKIKRMRNQRPGAINSPSRPTEVKGEGVSTPSGIQYWDIFIGEGNSAEKGHPVKVIYAAWVEKGKQFASSVADGKPVIFTLGAGQVISGWEQGILGMKAGGRRQIHIPPALAYGAAGLPPTVPPNSPLIFDVELLEVQ